MLRRNQSIFDIRCISRLISKLSDAGWSTDTVEKLISADIKKLHLIVRVLEGSANMTNRHLSKLKSVTIKTNKLNLQSFFKTGNKLEVNDPRFLEALEQVSNTDIEAQELAIGYVDTEEYGTSRNYEIISELPDNFAFDSFEQGLVYVAGLINNTTILAKPYKNNRFYVKLGDELNDYGVIFISQDNDNSVWECGYDPYLDISSTNCGSRTFIPIKNK